MKHEIKSRFLILLAVALWAFCPIGTSTAMAQKKRENVTLNVNSVSIDQLFQQIKKQTGYNFVISSELASSLPKITAKAQAKPVRQFLNEELDRLGCTYDIDNLTITVYRKDANKGERTVSGIVRAENGDVLPGVPVCIGESRVCTITDANGYYEIKVPASACSLKFTYVGMKTAYVNVKAGTTAAKYDVVLTGSTNLDNVVVVGYGSLKRKDLTGSVSTVNADELRDLPAVTVDDALAGRASGVQVTKADGTPGGGVRIRIRGGASLSGSADPLYIIDGIPTEIKNNYVASTDQNNPIEWSNYGEQGMGGVSGAFMRGLNNLSGLNINDIESINILKDASATAIYGSKAANGVVIITTKKGRHEQKPTFNVHLSHSVMSPLKEELCNAQQYLTALRSSLESSNINLEKNKESIGSRYGSLTKANTERLALLDELEKSGVDTDWLDLILQTAHTNNVDFSVSGGGKSSRYYTAFGYNNSDGTIINTNYNRLSGKVNVDFDITSRFRMGTNINLSYTKNNITNSCYGQALSAPPVLSPWNADGSYASYEKVGGVGSAYMGFQNALAVAQATNRAKSYGMKGSFYGEVDIIDGLRFKSVASIDYTSYDQTNFTPSFLGYDGGYYGYTKDGVASGTNAHRTLIGTFWENTLTYDKMWNGEVHHLNAVIGHAWEQQKASWFSATGKGYPDDNILTGLGSAQTAASVDGADPESKVSLLSFYGRLNYTLLDRYLFTFTARSDASSKFAKGHRVGFFPSGAIAWRISQEEWLRDTKWIDEIKIRASIGKTGTQSISDYMYLSLYRPGAYAGSSALYPSQMGNDAIEWESTNQWDLGLDYSFFNGRLSGTFGYYHKITDGALLSVPIAPSSGYSNLTTNIARIRNVGIEFDIQGDIIRTKDWRWNMSLNITHNSSKCLKIQGDLFSSADNRQALNLGTSVFKEGESLGLLCGYKVNGILETEEQVAAYKKKFTGWANMSSDLGVGSYEFDIDETGYYHQDVIGNSQPDIFGGITTSVNYKNWGIQAHFTYSVGNDMMYMRDVNDMSFSTMGNRSTRILEASSANHYNPGKVLSTYNTTIMLNSLNVYDASYLKCSSISLTYSLPMQWTKALSINNLSAYITASNLFTITKYPGPDPAVTDDPYSIVGGGRDISSYPTSRGVTFGIRAGF